MRFADFCRGALAATAAVGFVVAPAPALAQTKPLPVVVVLSTGGTIAGKGGGTTALSEYKSGTIKGEELVAAVPEIKSVADVRVEQISNVGSTNMTTAIWLTLANRINTLFANDPNISGIVITHGTNTMEETAYFLNLTVKHDRPVVLVGAQRPATAISADGPLNLLNAVRAAAAPVSRGKGVLLIMNDEINGARDVMKSNTYRAEAFRSGELGFLGYVDPDEVVFYRSTTRRHTAQSEFDVSGLKQLPKVEVFYSYVEPSVAPIKAMADAGAAGIVIAGTGAGGMSNFEKEALTVAGQSAAKPVLIRSNRTGNGRVIPRRDYDKLGFIAGDNLSPQKARVLLMVALTKTNDVKELRRIFNEY